MEHLTCLSVESVALALIGILVQANIEVLNVAGRQAKLAGLAVNRAQQIVVVKADARAKRGNQNDAERRRPATRAQGIPVDMQRLIEVSDSPEHLRELVDIYLLQSNDLVENLGEAIRSGEAKEVVSLAHKCLGASASCGMNAIVPALRELERIGRSGYLNGAEQLHADARGQLDRIQRYLSDYLQGC